MKADVIVCTLNQTDRTLECLGSVRRYSPNARLIWLDNGSERSSREAVMEEAKAMPDAKTVWCGKNLGFLGGVNLALKLVLQDWRTDSDYVAILHNDAVVTPGWMERMAGIMDRDRNVFAVGPVSSEGPGWQSYPTVGNAVGGFKAPRGFVKEGIDGRAQKLFQTYGDGYAHCFELSFFCVLIRKEVFQSIGLLDPTFFPGPGCEEDFCRRMANAGMGMAISTGTYVEHMGSATYESVYAEDRLEALRAEGRRIFEVKYAQQESSGE